MTTPHAPVAVSDTISQTEHVLDTDALIKRLVKENGGRKVLARWRGKERDAIAFSRRMLMMAMLGGNPNHQDRTVYQRHFFEKLGESAQIATKAIDAFLF